MRKSHRRKVIDKGEKEVDHDFIYDNRVRIKCEYCGRTFNFVKAEKDLSGASGNYNPGFYNSICGDADDPSAQCGRCSVEQNLHYLDLQCGRCKNMVNYYPGPAECATKKCRKPLLTGYDRAVENCMEWFGIRDKEKAKSVLFHIEKESMQLNFKRLNVNDSAYAFIFGDDRI